MNRRPTDALVADVRGALNTASVAFSVNAREALAELARRAEQTDTLREALETVCTIAHLYRGLDDAVAAIDDEVAAALSGTEQSA